MKSLGYFIGGVVLTALILFAIGYYQLSKIGKTITGAPEGSGQDDAGGRKFNTNGAPQNLTIGGEHCTWYGTGPNGEPIYNCNGTIRNAKGVSYGSA